MFNHLHAADLYSYTSSCDYNNLSDFVAYSIASERGETKGEVLTSPNKTRIFQTWLAFKWLTKDNHVPIELNMEFTEKS